MANAFSVPADNTVKQICEDACNALASRTYYSPKDGLLKAKFCSACDGIATVENPCGNFELANFVSCLVRFKAEKQHVLPFFPPALIEKYTAADDRLKSFIISPSTQVLKDDNGEETVHLCQDCTTCFEAVKKKNPKKKDKTYFKLSPSKAIWRGLLVGGPPQCITKLRAAELALVSPNRVITHGMTLYADHHKGIQGWHTMFENSVGQNMEDISQLVEAGLEGEIICVLCGPFTKTQHALVREQLRIRPEVIREAFEWLKLNNHYYGGDFCIPETTQFRQPKIIQDDTL